MKAELKELMVELQRQLAVAIEAFDQKLDTVIELVGATEERLDRKIDSVRDELKADITQTQLAVKVVQEEGRSERVKQSEQLGDQINGVAVQVRENRAAIARVEVRLDQIDQRTSRLEQKVG